MLYSEIKNKKVYSIQNAELLGSVCGILIDKVLLKPFFLVLDTRVLIDLKDVYGANDCLTVRSLDNIEIDMHDYFYFDNEIDVIDVEGNSYNQIDISLKNKKLLANGQEMPMSRLLTISKQVIIINPRKKRIFKKQSQKPRLPSDSLNDYSFLLGRRVVNDITDLSGSLFIKAATKITQQEIEKAKKAGKLVDLTINSKKP